MNKPPVATAGDCRCLFNLKVNGANCKELGYPLLVRERMLILGLVRSSSFVHF